MCLFVVYESEPGEYKFKAAMLKDFSDSGIMGVLRKYDPREDDQCNILPQQHLENL